jgi:hypothetical protein
MPTGRKREEYRRHVLVAAERNGRWMGRAWKEKTSIADAEGETAEAVLDALRGAVDSRFELAAVSRGANPKAAEYVVAFRTILDRLSDGHLAMLKAHYHAHGRRLTATELANAAGYANYSAANLQYGLVGKAIYEEVPMELPRLSDGSLIYTFTLAIQGNPGAEEEQWIWEMRPEVAHAIEELGLLA